MTGTARRTPAEQYLRHLQREYYLSRSLPPPKANTDPAFDRTWLGRSVDAYLKDSSEEERQQALAEVDQLLAGSYGECPEWEYPHGYFLTRVLSQKIADAAVKAGAHIPHDLTIGTLVTGDVNARAIAVPHTDGQYVVVFDVGMFGHCNLMAKAVAGCYPVKVGGPEGKLSFSLQQEHVEANIAAHPRLVDRFVACLLAYVALGDPHKAPHYFISSREDVMAKLLRDGAELFVLGHEYGHVIAGHLFSEKQDAAALSSPGTGPVEEYLPSWSMEMEADVYGLVLSAHALQADGWGFALSQLGAVQFLACASAIDVTLALLLHGDVEAAHEALVAAGSSTHPSPLVRWHNLDAALESVLPDKVEDVRVAAHSIWNTVLHLLEVGTPALLRAYADGVRPAAFWLANS